jgi:hypothetical protein
LLNDASAINDSGPNASSTDGSVPSYVSLFLVYLPFSGVLFRSSTGIDSVTNPQPTGGSDGQSNPTTVGPVRGIKSNAGIIVGAVIGVLVLTAILIAAALYLRRRSKARSRKLNRDLMLRQHPVDPFTLKHASIFASESQVEQAFPYDEKRPIPLEETEASEPLQATNSPPGPPADVSRRPSGASSLTPSTTATIRQQQLQEQEEASAIQLASLEARIGSSEWVSRAEYNAAVADMARLRAETLWLREAQQSDWALGLSDEMPPPYSHSRVNSR